MLMQQVNRFLPEVIHWRRQLHENPELSFQERETALFVTRTLESMGIGVTSIGPGYGRLAFVGGEKEGPTIAIRADIDALPLQDAKTCAYRSQVPGVVHACAHDAHTATLLGVAGLLTEYRSHLRGCVALLFQPAEEQLPGGARGLIEAGALSGVSEIFGIHYGPFPVGKIGIRPGLAMGLVDRFTIRLSGTGGHPGQPHQGNDAALAAAHLLVLLQTVTANAINPAHPAVVAVGEVHAGRSYNTLAETAELVGSLRCLSTADREILRTRLHQATSQIGAIFQMQTDVVYEEGYPPLINHAASARFAEGIARQVIGQQCLLPPPPLLSGDDFAHYLQRVPGCYVMVGSAGIDPASSFPLHDPRFDLDEQALGIGMKFLVGAVLGRLAPDLLEALTAGADKE